MNVSSEIKTGKSKEGKDYIYVSIMLTPTYEKRVFLDKAELEILKLSNPELKDE